MPTESTVAAISRLSAQSVGVFRGKEAVGVGVTRNQLSKLLAQGVVERLLPDTYRMTAVPRSSQQQLRAALLWAGDRALASGRSAGEIYGLEGVTAAKPEIALPKAIRARSTRVTVYRSDPAALMPRRVKGIPVTGIECTLLRLAAILDDEAFEIACEDARRRKLTSVAALHAYLAKFGRPGRPGVQRLRQLLSQIDATHPSRSTLEVKTRRLLVAHGLTDFVREFPLEWEGRRYLYDFAFVDRETILETNGRRWHHDVDYEGDNEKWSVPGRHGYRIVLATWDKVVNDPDRFLRELGATLARVSRRERRGRAGIQGGQ